RNGNVRAAHAMGEKILPIEIEVFGPDDDRVAVCHHTLCSYSLELGEDEQARRHFQAYALIYQRHPKKSWQRRESTRRLALLEAFLRIPLAERRQLFGLHRQMEQDVENQQLDRALEA